MTNGSGKATRAVFAGLFLVTLATLMFEIVLTRIFSVTLWYHFAFMAISVAMFGMTAGALLVYLTRHRFTADRTQFHLALSALLFGVTIVAAFLIHLAIPSLIGTSNLAPSALALTYAVISGPFVFSGVCVCLALTRFPRQVGKLYAADLAGAAAGCILIIYALKLTDGPTAVMICAFIACLGATSFGASCGHPFVMRAGRIAVISLGVFVIVNTVLVRVQNPILHLVWVRGAKERKPLYERWNSFSRVIVDGDPFVAEEPFGWGLSSRYAGGAKARQLSLRIDSGAETVLTGFPGDLASLDYLKFDITNLAHYLRSPAKVLVVGAGGGRDVLSALVFHQPSVLGVEINENIISTLNNDFGNFTGHLDCLPGVQFVNDEARSYIARQHDQFDIIQISLIDTWAATAAGAFVLAENSLYTVEAWTTFLSRLTPGGVLSLTRWYRKDGPVEAYRLTTLAVETLRRQGIREPRSHLVMARTLRAGRGGRSPDGLATLLVSPQPFSEHDLSVLDQVTQAMGFEIVVSPQFALDPDWARLASGAGPPERLAPLRLDPPTDDCPFFFQVGKLTSYWNLWSDQPNPNLFLGALRILMISLWTVLALTVLAILLPLFFAARHVSWRGTLSSLIYFAAIGSGFMLVEISQMQRLMIFLGHPTYGLSVVLFALLISSGLGSLTTGGGPGSGPQSPGWGRWAGLMGFLLLFGAVTPSVIRSFAGSPTAARILVAILTLFPLGFFMGMAFPLGMTAALKRSPALTPWLWGINGACSVLASVLAVVISINSGISTSFWTGAVCYVVAVVTFARLRRGVMTA